MTDKLLDADVHQLKTFEIQQLMDLYNDTHIKVDSHQDKNNLLNNDFTDPVLEKQREDLLNELLYYQAFKKAYNEANNIQSSKEFYTEIKDLNKNFFNKDINITQCIKDKPNPVINTNTYNNVPNDSRQYFNDGLPTNNYPPVKPTDPLIFQKNFYQEDRIDRKYNNNINNNGLSQPLYDNYNNGDSVEHLYNDSKANLNTDNNEIKNQNKEIKDWNQILDDSPLMNESGQNLRYNNIYVERADKEHIDKPAPNYFHIDDYENGNKLRSITNNNNNINSITLNYKADEFNNRKNVEDAVKTVNNDHRNNNRLIDVEKSVYKTPANQRSGFKAKSRFENTWTRSDRMSGSNISYKHKKYDNSGTEFVHILYDNINRALERGHQRPGIRNFSQVF